jgi:predicted GNAT family N-acyltransferase
MDDTAFSVRIADWAKDEDALRSVRNRVFVHEQEVPESEEWDGQDPDCVHAVAEIVGQGVVATGRLHPAGKIGRMAVLENWRGQGIGAGILRRLLREAVLYGLEDVYLHAQVRVVDFYSRFGFQVDGPEFMEAGIPHRLMRLHLPMPGDEDGGPDEPTGTRRLLSGMREFSAAVTEVASVASRSLAIFTPDLEHGVYDTTSFLEVIKRLVLSRSHARIRVLIGDPGRVQRSVNRFLYVGRRLSSFIEFRHLPEIYQDRSDAFLIADAAALVYRIKADRWEGIADTREPRMARHYLGQFEQMWQLSESAQEIREVR